jgi:hypothetical protein
MPSLRRCAANEFLYITDFGHPWYALVMHIGDTAPVLRVPAAPDATLGLAYLIPEKEPVSAFRRGLPDDMGRVTLPQASLADT